MIVLSAIALAASAQGNPIAAPVENGQSMLWACVMERFSIAERKFVSKELLAFYFPTKGAVRSDAVQLFDDSKILQGRKISDLKLSSSRQISWKASDDKGVGFEFASQPLTMPEGQPFASVLAVMRFVPEERYGFRHAGNCKVIITDDPKGQIEDILKQRDAVLKQRDAVK